ncbi:SDR family NAD(P)-dependent oxidoreductase [Saccharibacillus endophyticus]
MRKTVLITGASGGIGKELADRFAKDRSNLILIARNEEKLLELAKIYREKYEVQVTVIAKDVAAPDVPEEIFTELEEQGIAVDDLINNAGLGLYGNFCKPSY